MADSGLEVHVVAADAPRDARAASLTEIRPTRNHHLVAWLGATNESERIAATDLPRADFVYQRHALGAYAGLPLARRWDVPLVLEYNGSEVWSARQWFAHRPTLLGLAARLERRMLREASLIVVVSNALFDELLGRPASRPTASSSIPTGLTCRRSRRFALTRRLSGVAASGCRSALPSGSSGPSRRGTG